MIADIHYQTAAAAHDADLVIEERDSRKPLADLTPSQIAHLSHGTFAACDVQITILRPGPVYNVEAILEHWSSGAHLRRDAEKLTVCDAWSLAAHMMKCMEGDAR